MAENEIEEQKSGMSIGDIFRIIFSQKWVALIILVVVTLAGTLGLYYGSNAISKTYDVSFTLELPQTNDNAVIKDENGVIKSPSTSVVYYPDGTPFYYTDIVSLTTLKKVKKLNEAFEDIDVDAMSKRGGISIERSIYETANNSGTYESTYNLTVKANYFPNQDVAREFLEALTQTPTDYLGLMEIDFDVYIDSARIAPDYATEINQLEAQLEYLLERYRTFVDLYNDLSINGKSLRSYAQEINSYLNDSVALELLLSEARQNGYLKSPDLKDKYETELYMLKRQLTIADSTLSNLLTVKEGSESLSVSSAAIIKEQSDLVAELKEQIREIEEIYQTSNYIGDAVPAEFKNGLNEAYARVEEFTKVFENVVAQLYTKVSVISYSNSNVIVTNGVTGMVKAFIISLVAGVVLALIVAFIVGWVVMKKNAAKAPAVQTADTQSEINQSENK